MNHEQMLSPDSASLFESEGFLSIEALTTTEDIACIRSLLDPIFENFEQLPKKQAGDMAGDDHPDGRPRILEINRTVSLQPKLRNTLAYQRCRRLAHELLKAPVGYVFDNAIYKPPYNGTPTHWHQDDAYTGRPVPLKTVHFWIPLQSVSVENGCMYYIPGSHRCGLNQHQKIASRPIGDVLRVTGVDVSAAVACPLGVGGATLHHALTLHYSGPNQTDTCRRVWVIHFGAYGRLGIYHPRNLMAKLLSRLKPR